MFNETYGLLAKVSLQEWETANERLRILREENDVLMEQHNAQQGKILDLESELQSSKQECEEIKSHLDHEADDNDELREEVATVESIKVEMEERLELEGKKFRTLQVQNDWLNEELRRLAKENTVSQKSAHDCKKSINDLTIAYKNAVRDAEAMARRQNEALEDMNAAEAEVDVHRAIHMDASQTLSALNEDYGALMDTCKSLELRITELQQSELNLSKVKHEHAQEMETAAIERERAKMTEKHTALELKRLKERHQQVSSRHLERLQGELETQKTAFALDRQRLMSELSDMQVTKAELMLQVDRALREKRSIEQETDKIRKHLPIEMDRLNVLIEEMQERLRRLERERDDSLYALEKASQKLGRETDKHEKEKLAYATELDSVSKRMRKLESESEDAKMQCVKMFDQVTTLERTRQKLDEEKNAVASQASLTIAALKRSHETQMQELGAKYNQSKELNVKLNKELQELLSEQQLTSVRWKEESKALSHKYERLINDLRDKIASLTERVQRSNDDQVRLRAVNDDLNSQVTEERKSHARLHQLLKQAENRTQLFAKQMNDFVGREKSMMLERKELQRQVDRLTVEQRRLERESKFHPKLGHNHGHQKKSLDFDSISMASFDDSSASVQDKLNAIQIAAEIKENETEINS